MKRLLIIALCFFIGNISSDPFSSPLLDNVYAVHATQTLPESDYIRAGLDVHDLSPSQKALLSGLRVTLHFSLGELVRPIEGFKSWEDVPYALVTPLRLLLPQLINLNCYDTFILGDLKLGPETYLVVPAGIAETIQSQATVVAYDPQNQTLRQAVDVLIASKGGWHIQMDDRDIEDELHEAFLNGLNINTKQFFAPLQEGRPWLAIGLRFNPLEGHHFRLSQIEQRVLSVAFPLLFIKLGERTLNNPESAYLRETVSILDKQFQKWSQSLDGFPSPPESLQAYEKIESIVKKWTALLQEELYMREVYGKTLAAAPDDFLLKLTSLLHDPQALRSFISQNQHRLADYRRTLS